MVRNMAEILIKKKFYHIEFDLASSLAVGSGNNVNTDKDIIRDGRNTPYIPGSALAGIGRDILNKYAPDEIQLHGATDRNTSRPISWVQYYCGDVEKASETNKEARSIESRILFYDATLVEAEHYVVSVRDGVALDEWKTALKGNKYDYEILEPGLRFETLIEQDIYGEQTADAKAPIKRIDVPAADLIAREWLSNRLYVGAKTSRGYGAIENVSIRTREFNLEKSDEAIEYARFDPFNTEEWLNADSFTCDRVIETMIRREESRYSLKLMLDLTLKGAILIRKYSTQVEKGKSMPDYSQQYILDSENSEVPVIPGTSWAGAFSAQMERIIPGSTAGYFGSVDKINKTKKKSQIRFSESILKDSEPKQISRNAIDRFSGGTIDGALFTEKNWYGGTTTLEISFGKDTSNDFDKALAASIADLNNGFMAIGGSTSVGRGIFCVNKINGQTVQGNSLYRQVLDEIKKMKGK